jgi:hypothetical protein
MWDRGKIMDGYLFEGFTVEKWVQIIVIVWGAAIIWAILTSLLQRIKSPKDREPSGICAVGCGLLGFVGGVCTLNLVVNTLKIDFGFPTVLVLFFGWGIIGGSSYSIGNLFIPKK